MGHLKMESRSMVDQALYNANGDEQDNDKNSYQLPFEEMRIADDKGG